MDHSDAQVVEVMRRLGVSRGDLIRAQSTPRALDALKSRLRKSYRKLALEWHPDRTGGDPEKASLFQLATRVVQEIGTMEAHPHPRRVRWGIRIKATAAT